MSALRRLADNTSPTSLATRMRRRRFRLFRTLLESVPRPLRILDLGGTAEFWRTMEFADEHGVEIVLLNVDPRPVATRAFSSVRGDARDLSAFADREFEVVFSSSVIEHVGGWDDQARMAAEIRRVGARYFVQTPSRHFPLEPHFLVPGFQYLPVRARAALVRRFALGHVGRVPEERAARECVESIRLLTAAEMHCLFPDGALFHERVLGLTKSLVACGGWERPEAVYGAGVPGRKSDHGR